MILRAASSEPSAITVIAEWMLRPIPTPPPLPIATQLAPCAALSIADSTGQSAIASEPSRIALGLARGRGDRVRVHVVAAERERADLAARDELVEPGADRLALAEAEPADARGQALRGHARAGEREPAGERVGADHLEHGVLAPPQVLGIAAQADPAVGADAARQDRAHVLGDEARDLARALDAGELRLGAQAVAVLEDDRAAVAQREQRLGVRGERAAHRASWRGPPAAGVGVGRAAAARA